MITENDCEKHEGKSLSQDAVSCNVFENFELEYIDYLVNTDFILNKEKFSKSKIEKVNILIQKIKKLRLL